MGGGKARGGGLASSTFDVTLVVNRVDGEAVEDDIILLHALERGGTRARMCRWDDPGVDWSTSTITVLRSCWDYFHDIGAWLAWLDRVSRVTGLVNDVELVRWNSTKAYLLDLERAGVPIVPTVIWAAGDHAPARPGWRSVVVKPAAGGGGHGVSVVHDVTPEALESHRRQRGDVHSMLLQEFQPSVHTARERSLVFVGGRFAHAFTKPAFDRGGGGDPDRFALHEPSEAEMSVAVAALAAAPTPAHCGRVDLVPSPSGPLVMELELIEPDLLLRCNARTLQRYADHLSTLVCKEAA